ncbi:longevity assurance proteins LAG1/LAC1 [Delitschia confertaspora ATCC 74209]|uniref:Longevity assurance proteins LAG1/LAC1 n=1 Tax=Delitschia confertaspora ATCC 74209 TaxID=1513339 RepID=A0A9P4JQC8_9PLEO|nr:longevity assurance proteins LAG1/LAC1 [Delitschia confertaspora ATCC 74209]
MTESSLEPFPPLSPPQHSFRHQASSNGTARRRRKSSGLGSDIPGDSDVAAFATLSQSMNPSAHARHPSDKPARRLKRRTIKRYLSKWKRISFKHTWLNPLVLCLIGVSLYLVNPTPENPLSAALFLSYPLPREPGADPDTPIQYGKGARDFAFVAFYTIFFTFTREFLMQRMIRPIAIWCGIRNRGKQARFMEQFYTAIYFAVFGPFGLWIMSRTPIWYFRTEAMYEGFPHKTHEGVFKAYYLLQACYWAQQMIVMLLMLEKPRKDFKELVAHHIITLSLIWLSYRFHFTYMGIAVYITHDISDFFLATSKCLNYIDSPIVGPYYFTFMAIWAYTRHYMNLKILLSIITQFANIGPYELNWETQQYKCWISQVITFALLATLQAINLFWWFLICRIAYRFVVSAGEEVKDERSEYEPTDEEDLADGVDGSADGSAASYAKVAAKGTPKVMLNGRPVPRTPSPGSEVVEEQGTIGSRLKERKRSKK